MPQHPRLTTPLVGHEGNVAWFREAFVAGRLPHALLLRGPKGVGKATFAYHAARSLLREPQTCETFFHDDPQDPLFRRVGARSHADLFVMEQELREDGKLSREIPIASARSLKASFARTAMEGGWRVGIVDSVDALTHQGAQALLKLLEEPPQKCCLFLVHHGAPLLATIASRCQALAFDGLGDGEACRVMEAQGVDASNVTPRLLTLFEGSPGLVMAFVDEMGSACSQDFDALVEAYGSGRAPSFTPFLDAHFPARSTNLMVKVDVFLEYLMRWVRASLKETLQGTASGATAAFMGRHPLDAWSQTWSTLQRLKSEGIRLNFDPRHVLILSLESFLNGASSP